MAQLLIDNGIPNAKALLGGYAAWQRAEFPTETTSGAAPAP